MRDREASRGSAWGWALGLFAVAALVVGVASGKGKPNKPPPPTVDSGTIYFVTEGVLCQVNPDGSGQTALPSSIVYWAEPSRHSHEGRWFLQVQHVAGETYPGTDPNTGEALPRLELFAVHESGSPVVQLTDGEIDATSFVEPNNNWGQVGGADTLPRWTDGDTRVSYLGVRSTYDASGNRTVHEGGVYAVDVEPDALAQHTPTAVSGPPLLPLMLNPAATQVLAQSYDWRPDGGAIVYPNHHDVPARLGVWIAWASDGFANPTFLMANGTHLRWSPDGSRIVFVAGDICSIRADGTDQQLLVAKPRDSKKWSNRLQRPCWSPNGTYIAYHVLRYRISPWTIENDLVRATAAGEDNTTLGAGSLPRWRE
jgi:hypothetical protein